MIGIPIPLFIMSLLIFFFVIKYDGPSFYLATHRVEQAERSFNSIMDTWGDQSHFEKLRDEHERSAKVSSS